MGQCGGAAAPAAPRRRLAAQVDRRGEGVGRQRRIGQREGGIGAAIATGV
jgi:hypothetical protein